VEYERRRAKNSTEEKDCLHEENAKSYLSYALLDEAIPGGGEVKTMTIFQFEEMRKDELAS
jgi:hypothetical protein